MDKTMEHFAFDPPEGLESKAYSPTYPESEEAIRAQIQGVSNQLKDKLNAIIDLLSDETAGQSGADYIASEPIDGIVSRRVGGQLRELFALMQHMALGAIPDGTITAEKLAESSVTTEKYADGSITKDKITAEGITNDWFRLPPAKIKVGTYMGNGNFGASHPTKVTVDFTPKAILIVESYGTSYGTHFVQADTGIRPTMYTADMTLFRTSSAGVNGHISFGANTISWYSESLAKYQQNDEDTMYFYIVIGV